MAKNFVAHVNPRDVLEDVKGLSESAVATYLKFWMLHHLHGEPLPPSEERLPASEWDEWFRDKLGMKNVRTWRRGRDELIKAARIRRDADGRLYIGRTRRDLKKRKRWNGPDDDGQPELPLAHNEDAVVPRPMDQPVDRAVDDRGQAAGSGEVRANIERSSAEVRAIRPSKSLIRKETRAAYSYSDSIVTHEVVVAGTRYPRATPLARGDPLARPP